MMPLLDPARGVQPFRDRLRDSPPRTGGPRQGCWRRAATWGGWAALGRLCGRRSSRLSQIRSHEKALAAAAHDGSQAVGPQRIPVMPPTSSLTGTRAPALAWNTARVLTTLRVKPSPSAALHKANSLPAASNVSLARSEAPHEQVGQMYRYGSIVRRYSMYISLYSTFAIQSQNKMELQYMYMYQSDQSTRQSAPVAERADVLDRCVCVWPFRAPD
jgi:hypothetical protein